MSQTPENGWRTFLMVLLASERLTLWSLLPIVAVMAVVGTFHNSAFDASYAMLVVERECGFECSVVPVRTDGRVDPAEIQAAIRPDTIPISLMHAQNETGVLQPVGWEDTDGR